MSTSDDRLAEQFAAWRAAIRREAGDGENQAAELEVRLDTEITKLSDAGLSDEEAFVVGIRRLARTNEATRRFVIEHTDSLWSLGIAGGAVPAEPSDLLPNETLIVLVLSLVAAVAVKLPDLFGYRLFGDGTPFYARNLSFFVLPLVTLYFGWKRGLDRKHAFWIAVAFVIAAAIVNAFPFVAGGATEGLAALHLPIALWLCVGIAYTGGHWSSRSGRMDFVRFSGELFIYYVLICLGGGLLLALTAFLFEAIGIRIEPILRDWLLPCGAAGGFVIASWLVETKGRVAENLAPMLTRLFSPLFTVAMLAFLVGMAWTGKGINIERHVLIGFDLLLVVVLGLVLYTISARASDSSQNIFDWVQLLLLSSGLLVDLLALAAIAGRISEFGFSPNKTAALGLNLVLLVNLAWSAWLYVRFLSGRASFATIERWQTSYLPVYAGWAVVVVLVFPLMFGFA